MLEPQWERVAKTKMGRYLSKIETTFILKTVHFEGKVIADVGSGGGKFTVLALQKKAYVVSLDRDLNALKWLKHRNRLANPIMSDATALPLKEDMFDNVFLIEIFDYISESEKLMAECRRILKAKGLFVFSFGNSFSLKAKLKRLRGNYFMQDKRSYREVILLLNKLDFKVMRNEGYNWLFLNRESNSRLVHFFGEIVRKFKLNKILTISPWILVCASK